VPDPRRARELVVLARQSSVATNTPDIGPWVRAIWPQLALISAWGDATAADSARDLMCLFPGVEFQPKGLLATEGVVSFPLSAHPQGAALAVRSHFFEFEAEDGAIALADQLQPDRLYRVRITTGGGLFRYQLHDQIRVTGFWQGIPLMRFEGRAGALSDWYGEKLNPEHVRAALRASLPSATSLAGYLVALERRPQPRYVLWREDHGCSSEGHVVLAQAVEQRLRQSHHYDLCRRAGQLQPLEVRTIAPGALAQAQAKRALREGHRLGTQKPEVLDRRADWASDFILLRSET
jgi:hypothetical protein